MLNVGCGMGQTLVMVGFPEGACLVGMDAKAAKVGRKTSPALELHVSPTEALPQTDPPRSVAEIHGVPKPGGRVWLALHGLSIGLDFISGYLRKGNLRGAPGKRNPLANDGALHLLETSLPGPWSGTHGRFHARGGLGRLVERSGCVGCVAEPPPPNVQASRKGDAPGTKGLR